MREQPGGGAHFGKVDPLTSLDLSEDPDGITFGILVAPRASRERVGPVVGDRLRVGVTAPPVEGQANAAVVALLARALGVRRAAVSIVGGERGKRKRVRVIGATVDDLRRLL